MKKYQKILAILLVAAFALGLSGCRAGCGCPKFDTPVHNPF